MTTLARPGTTDDWTSCGSLPGTARRTMLKYGLILVSLWFEGTQFARGEVQFL
jgi:hypothetical protein